MKSTLSTKDDRAGFKEQTKIRYVEDIPLPFLYSMIPLNLVVGLTVIILNTLVGHFYRKGKRSTAALLYIYLTN